MSPTHEKVDKSFLTLFTKVDTDIKETRKALSELTSPSSNQRSPASR